MERANPVGSLLKVRTHPEILKLFVAWFLVYLAESCSTNQLGIFYDVQICLGRKNSRDFSWSNGSFYRFLFKDF